MQEPSRPSAPQRKDDRVLLHFDYDCFYAQVVENKDPSLRCRPLGIRQKNILATCNYHARRRGVRKLMLVSEAVVICPDLVLVSGEDLTPFRQTSKRLYDFFRSHSWNNKVERLGLDEVFMDITDMVDYNLSCLNRLTLADSFFCLSMKDPEQGFGCDLTSVAGCVAGPPVLSGQLHDDRYLRLLLASHLASYLRLKVETDFGYTSACGIATNKLLSKLVGSCNKPRNQTTLLAWTENAVYSFIDGYGIKQLPGIGRKMVLSIESQIHSQDPEVKLPLTVSQVRSHPSTSASSLETLFRGPGAEKGVGARVWRLIHGADPTEVKEATDVPAQISVEDTYKGLETVAQINEQLYALSCSLVRRMRCELIICEEEETTWLARPKTLRLSVRSWPAGPSDNFSRISRSGPLPGFVFDSEADVEDIAQQLTTQALIPLLRRLQSDSGQRWNVQLVNICVANMVDERTGAERDIAAMFKTQDEVLRPWRAMREPGDEGVGEAAFEEADLDGGWDSTLHSSCPRCGHLVPGFAMAAHARYHELEE
ncbi:hypothetical protein L249_2413 [Ophiocordyceps polyrhachis-furcata BCC 54312]|uniref:UmuC domain-containing protein n=1 Tax=Ophiocordyceps polyrhachis-furcata BCC 54312 TaxID=1330021 RepID=A0A367LQ54_9HYPO|nr:hypothetical protein L249_2413 [Ophiocordyceps polyrhachis-furcata BCC 54312]